MAMDHQGCDCGCGCHGETAGLMEPCLDLKAADDEEIICHCMTISKGAIVEAIRQGAFTVPLIKAATGAGRGKDCKHRHPAGRTCEVELEELIRLYGEQ